MVSIIVDGNGRSLGCTRGEQTGKIWVREIALLTRQTPSELDRSHFQSEPK